MISGTVFKEQVSYSKLYYFYSVERERERERERGGENERMRMRERDSFSTIPCTHGAPAAPP